MCDVFKSIYCIVIDCNICVFTLLTVCGDAVSQFSFI